MSFNPGSFLMSVWFLRKNLKDPKKRKAQLRSLSVAVYSLYYFGLGPFFYIINKIWLDDEPVIRYYTKQSSLLFIIMKSLLIILSSMGAVLHVFIDVAGYKSSSLSTILLTFPILIFALIEIPLGIYLAIKAYKNTKFKIFPFIKM